MLKRLYAFILVICMLFTILPIPAMAEGTEIASGTCGTGVFWRLDGDTLTIYGNGAMADYSGTDTPWNAYKSSISKLVIEDGVTYVGKKSFVMYTFDSVSIASSVSVIGENAFQFCTLPAITLPEGVTTIGIGAFYGCELPAIDLPDSLTGIGPWAFEACSGLASVTIPEGVTMIEITAFAYCTDLVEVNLPDTLIEIGESAFTWCNSLPAIVIPDGVDTIGAEAFRGCSSLGAVFIPDSVVFLEYNAFYACNNLTEVYYGGTETAWNALTNTPDADFVHYSITNPANHWCEDGQDATCTEDGYTRLICACGYEAGYRVVPSPGHTYVGNVCSACGSPEPAAGTCGTGVNWRLDGDTLTIYGNGDMADYSFAYFPSWHNFKDAIKNVVISENVTGIGSYAFRNYTNLTAVTIPGSVTSIGANAFSGCTGLTAVSIPDSVTAIGTNAFSGCTGLADVSLPDGITSIGYNTFSGCSSLTTVTIPENVTEIGASAFANCSNLTGITVLGNLSSVDSMAFVGCRNFTDIIFGNGVTSIGADTFYSCNNLALVVIPASVTNIGYDAFNRSIKITDVYYGGTQSQWRDTDNYPSARFLHLSVTDPTNHWSTIRVNATCTEGGHTIKECPCGHERFVYQNAFGHSFVNGSCTRCGKPEPGATHPMLESVTRVFGSTRYDTSFKSADTLKDLMGVDKFQNIIVASGENFPDALAGSYLASVKEAPILLVNNGTVESVKSYIRENLTPGGTVYLLGGTGVVPTSMETGLTGFTVKRLGGATRYDTNLQILLEAGIGDRDILVCTGTGFADSLSASAVGLPILLVGTSLTSAQRSLLSTCSGSIIIVGGWGAVSDYVASQLAAYGPVERLSGSTRYETSTLVAERFFDDPENAVLAYAENFPDGLSGGPIANRIGAPLILTMTGRETAAAQYSSTYGIRHGIILGGPTLIGDKAIRSVFSLGSDVTIATR